MTDGKSNLPRNPDLEHLRKEAKRRLAAMQARGAGARLTEAQHVLAREYGFSGWPALKDAVERARRTPLPRARHWRPLADETGAECGERFLPGVAGLPTGLVLMLGLMLLILVTLLSVARAETLVPDAAALDKYVGAYRFDPKHLFVVTRDGAHLFSQLGAQPQIEIFPQGGTKFAPKAVPAEIEFLLDAGGAVTAVAIHQNGRDISLPRLTQAEAAAIAAQPLGHPMPVTWPQRTITPRFLTPAGKAFDVWPCFSPDGKRVLFSRSNDRGQTWRFFTVAASGGDAVPLPADLPVSPTRCNWSAQNMIAFTGIAADHTSTLWVMRQDGSGVHAVTGPGSQTFYPSWYPDGKSVAVTDDSLTIRRIGLADGQAVALTDHAQVLTGMPSVSPDGKTVAFAGQPNKGQRYDQEENTIWLAQGGMARPLETPPLQGRAPVWSPDGAKIAFESDRGNAQGHYAIFVINRDGTDLAQLTDFALDATHPVFSRDGRHMVFSHGGAISGIAVMDLSP